MVNSDESKSAGRIAIVTGGSAGLGKALVGELLRCERSVVVVARDEAKLLALAEKFQAHESALTTIAADVTRQEDVDRVVDATIAAHGRIDMLINCAGRSTRAAVLQTTPEELQQMWEVNFLAAVRMTRACAEHLIARSGSVVNIGSLASKIASPFLGAYPATKHALAAYTQQLRLELGPRGLHVLLVCPGPIAREGETPRYETDGDLPDGVRRPGGGAKMRPLDPHKLARQILQTCEKRKAELVRPRRARLLFAAAAVSPRLGDWLLRKSIKQ